MRTGINDDGPYRFSQTVTAPGRPPSAPAAEESVGASSWYRRRAWLVPAVLVAVVGLAVVTTVPRHATRAGQISADASVMAQVNQDVSPCSAALRQAFSIYRDLSGRTVTKSGTVAGSGTPAQFPRLLREGESSCSVRDDGTYQLTLINVPESASGRDLGQLVRTVTVWSTSDALSAITQIQALESSPSDVSARQLLAHDVQLLDHDEQRANDELGAAGILLNTQLPALHLTKPPTSLSAL
jgi:hypothetical protein